MFTLAMLVLGAFGVLTVGVGVFQVLFSIYLFISNIFTGVYSDDI